MAKETNQLKFGDFQVIVIMVTYSQKVFYLGYVLKKDPNYQKLFFKTNLDKFDIEGVTKKSRLTSCHFTTISSQIFAIYITIFHKTEVQTVILRC